MLWKLTPLPHLLVFAPTSYTILANSKYNMLTKADTIRDGSRIKDISRHFYN